MKTLNQTTLILASHKIGSFILTDENSYHRVVILHRGLWERGMLLVLSDPWFDLDDGEDSEQVSGYSLDIITCKDDYYREWCFMETMVDENPWDLARAVMERLSWIDGLEPEQFLQSLDGLSESIKHLDKKPGDTTTLDAEMTSKEGRFRYGITLKSDHLVNKDESYVFQKGVFQVLMEGANAMLAPLNLNF